jgi:putative membrane protein
MKTNSKLVALSAGLVSIGLAVGAVAQQSGSATSAPKSSAKSDSKSDAKSNSKSALAGEDRTFVMKAAQDGMAEVELGRAAQQQASSDAVKQFGQRMVTDHGKANEELKSIVANKGVSLPSALDKEHAAHGEKLKRLKGPEFDREYMKHMVDDHKKAVALFEKTSKSAKDSDVKGFASKTLPTLQEHLKMAQSTQSQLGGSGKSGSAGSGSANSGGAPGTGKSPATGGSGTSKDRTPGSSGSGTK